MIPKVITGRERIVEQDSVLQKLVDFYRAFNQGDLRLMEENWLHSADASMSNPLGGVKRGWNEIATVYDWIFNGPAEVYVEYYDYSLHRGADMFTVVGRERGYFKLGTTRLELAIRTSRTYLRIEDDWRQLHHHGSIDDPALLNKYQQAVLSGN